MELFKLFVNDVLLSIYTSFGFSFLAACLAVFLYLYAFHPEKGGKGIGNALKEGFSALRTDKNCRHFFLFSMYVCMVLFKTLLNRNLWLNPLSNVLDGWWIWSVDGNGNRTLSSEPLENLVMLMPMVLLSVWTFSEWFEKKGYIKGSFLLAGGFSLFIETCQLLFRLGTFQFSDLFYNTAGGVIAGIVVCIVHNVQSNTL